MAEAAWQATRASLEQPAHAAAQQEGIMGGASKGLGPEAGTVWTGQRWNDGASERQRLCV